jgi:hypothetical protein
MKDFIRRFYLCFEDYIHTVQRGVQLAYVYIAPLLPAAVVDKAFKPGAAIKGGVADTSHSGRQGNSFKGSAALEILIIIAYIMMAVGSVVTY